MSTRRYINAWKGLLSLFLMLPWALLWSQSEAIAVIDFQGEGVSKDDVAVVTDRLRFEIRNLSSEVILERVDVEQAFHDCDFRPFDCVTSECLTEVGQRLGAAEIVGGSISRVDDTYSIYARILEVPTGRIINSIIYDFAGDMEELLRTGIRTVSELLYLGSGTHYTGPDKDYEYYDEGQLRAEGRSLAEKKLGRWIYYRKNGCVEKVGHFRDGKEIGTWTYYNDKGEVDNVRTFVGGSEVGRKNYFYREGKLDKIIEKEFDRTFFGKAIKKSKLLEYYPSGEVKARSDLIFGMVEGDRTVYSIDGEVLGVESFSGGKGIYTDHYENGQLKERGLCRDFNGIKMIRLYSWYRFSPSGELTAHIIYDSYGNIIEEKHY